MNKEEVFQVALKFPVINQITAFPLDFPAAPYRYATDQIIFIFPGK